MTRFTLPIVADVVRLPSSTARVGIRLCNFATGHALLRPLHEAVLDGMVKPLVAETPDSWVGILGYASHLGHAAFNKRLSYHRCESVRKRIVTYSDTVKFPAEWGLGDSQSTGAADNNDGYWRAVDVHVFYPSSVQPPRPDAPQPPPSIPAGKHFRVRVLRLTEGSYSVAVGDSVLLHIVDDDNRTCGVYQYAGAGLGFPNPIPHSSFPLSAAAAGAFSSFTSSRPLQLTAFTGDANLWAAPGVSVGSKSIGGQYQIVFNSQHLKLIQGLQATVLHPPVIPISTGKSFGLGFSTGSLGAGALSTPSIKDPGECCGAPDGVCTKVR